MNEAVYLNKATKRFGSVVAVDCATFAVEDRSFTVLLGPSGCGKTTVLRSIAGFYDLDEGEIYIKGKVVTNVPPHKRNTGMVFQNYALFPHMKVFDNIAYGLKFRPSSKAEADQRVRKVAGMLGIEHLLTRFPAQLSGGEQQRVAVARALVIEPEVLLLDEPLSNLDAKVRVRVRVELKKLQRELGITAIHVTHDQEEALAIGDRVVVMNKGKVTQIGSPAEVYFKPRTRFVADFIGTTNLLKGKVTRTDEKEVVLSVASGVSLSALASPEIALRDAQEVTLSVRPESIEVNAERPLGRANILQGEVKDVIFMGATTRYFVQSGGLELIADVQGSETPLKGVVYISMDSTKLHILPELD